MIIYIIVRNSIIIIIILIPKIFFTVGSQPHTVWGLLPGFVFVFFCQGLSKVCPDLFSIQMQNCIAA